ncbi:MAG TPA: hypothetical protein VFJ15_00570 [Oleiagrimonas sp.]|nr:hypothetical protein [Oleiagrimonas sp.]
MRRLTVLILCLAVATGAIAADATPKTPHTAMIKFQRDLVNVLALRAEAEPLLGAALLTQTLPDPPDYISYHALLTRAAGTADAGPAVTWAQLVDCNHQARACPNAKALARLEKQAPDNAATWLMALGQAARNNDDEAARQALNRAAAASRYDDYHGITLKALAMAARALPPPATLYQGEQAAANSAAGVRALLVFGLGSLQPMPGFQSAARICKDAKDDAATRATCLRLAKTLTWGSSPLARSLGLHLKATLANDAATREQAKAATRDLVWQVHNFGQLTLKTRHDPELARALLKRARAGGTRMSLTLAALRAAHIPVHAPAGWQPGGKSTSAPTSG